MIDLQSPFRSATPNDAVALAELINLAGEGMPLYIWGKIAEAGETAWDVGYRRARREDGSFSYRNSIVLEANGAVAACLIGYPLPDEPEPIDYDSMPPMFAALQELENLAPGTWYVNVLAVYPDYQGMGLGTRLLSMADQIAADLPMSGLSIIVSDANTGARRLYESCGYCQVAERRMAKEDWKHAGEQWVLLVKTV
jgi:ribosomal protein S18 acetylase RimI-like enzyme